MQLMAATAYLHPMTTLVSSSPQQTRPPLRRATYVHVSDLTSAYNIDHARLEQEFARVKAEREKFGDTTLSTVRPPTSRKTGATDIVDAAAVDDGAADDLETIGPQKRLQPPRGGFNLCVLVGKVNVVVDKKRVDQSNVRLAEVEIGDETGSVSLRARDDQIDLLEEVSKRSGAVVLRNCTLELYQGRHIRLAVTKWGKLSAYPDNVASTPPPPSKMNTDRNFSLIDLSLVASEMVETSLSLDPSYSGRHHVKASEPEHGGSGVGSSKPQVSQGGQSTQKHHQAASSKRGRRGSGERRQTRGKTPPGGPMAVHYGGIKQDTLQPPPPDQVMYHAMPGYSSYEQGMGLRPYPPTLAHASRQDVSTQQLLLQQQYEIQQRQLQQIYGQEHHRLGHQVQETPQMLIRPMDSFESSSYAGDVSDQHRIQLMGGITASPLHMPMGTPGQTMAQPSHESYPSPGHQAGGQQDGSTSQQRPSGAMSPYNIGKMNPDASSYTPSYLSAAQGQAFRRPTSASTVQFAHDYPPGQGIGYPPSSSHYQGFYSPAGVVPGATYAVATPQERGTIPDTTSKSHRHVPGASGSKSSTQSGKENVTSSKK